MTPREDSGWVGINEVAKRLHCTIGEVRKLEESGRIRTRNVTGGERGKRYSAKDVGSVRDHIENPVPLVSEAGLDPLGHVPDWKAQRFVDRVDACWFFLMAHGYLDREDSEKLRAKIASEVRDCGAKGSFLSCAPSASDLYGG